MFIPSKYADKLEKNAFLFIGIGIGMSLSQVAPGLSGDIFMVVGGFLYLAHIVAIPDSKSSKQAPETV